MSRLDYVHAFRLVPPKCRIGASFRRRSRIWAEHGDIAAEACCLQPAWLCRARLHRVNAAHKLAELAQPGLSNQPRSASDSWRPLAPTIQARHAKRPALGREAVRREPAVRLVRFQAPLGSEEANLVRLAALTSASLDALAQVHLPEVSAGGRPAVVRLTRGRPNGRR